MKWEQLYDSVHSILQTESPPSILVIHCGANSMGTMPLRKLRNFMKFTISQIATLLPNTLIVWSEWLPRLTWRHMLSNVAAEKDRLKLNSCVRTFLINQKRGACIKHPDIKVNQTKFFTDGVHLSEIGNALFLNNLQGGLYTFLKGKSVMFPQ